MPDSRTPYAHALQQAVEAAAAGDYPVAADALRTAMKLRFDARLARALDLVQIGMLRQEPSVHIEPVLAALLEGQTAPTSGSNGPESPAPGAPLEDGPTAVDDAPDTPQTSEFALDMFADEIPLDFEMHVEVSTVSQRVTQENPSIEADPHQRTTGELSRADLEARVADAEEEGSSFLERQEHVLRTYLAASDFMAAHRLLMRTPLEERDADWGAIRQRIDEEWREHVELRLRPTDRVVFPALDEADFHSQDLDARTMFLYAQVDGMCTIADLIDLSGMPTFEAMRTICRMLDQGLIRF